MHKTTSMWRTVQGAACRQPEGPGSNPSFAALRPSNSFDPVKSHFLNCHRSLW